MSQNDEGGNGTVARLPIMEQYTDALVAKKGIVSQDNARSVEGAWMEDGGKQDPILVQWPGMTWSLRQQPEQGW